MSTNEKLNNTEVTVPRELNPETVRIGSELSSRVNTILDNASNPFLTPEEVRHYTNETYLLVHEYTRPISDVSADESPKPDSRFHAFTSLEAIRNIRIWTNEGKNPFQEAGLVDHNELRKLTKEEQKKNALNPKENNQIEDVIFLGLIGFEDLLNTPQPKIAEETKTRTKVSAKLGDKLYNTKETLLRADYRIRKLGSSLVAKTLDKVDQTFERKNRIRRLSNSALATLAIFGVSRGNNNEQDASNTTVSEPTSHVYEQPDSTTTTTIDLSAQNRAAGIPSILSQTDIPPLPPAPETVEIVTIPEGSNLWDELQKRIQGSDGAEADADMEAQRIIGNVLKYIAVSNGMTVEDLNHLSADQVLILSDAANALLDKYKQD